MGLRSSYVKYNTPRVFDLIGASILSIFALMFITGFDIFMHDIFVFPTYHCDYPPDSEKPECQKLLQVTTITTPLFQYEIQGRQWYWIWMGGVALVPAIMAFIFRGFILGSKLAGILWALTIYMPITSGFEDVLYFYFMNQPIPTELPWLAGNPYIATVNSLINGGGTITDIVMYEAMGSAVVILGILWIYGLKKPEIPIISR